MYNLWVLRGMHGADVESFIKQLSSYEIITPVRVNDFGESFPHKLHYRRRRRSLSEDLSGLRVHYRIDAFGDRFHLNLTAESGFIAPSYTVTHLGAEQRSDAADSHFQEPGDMRHCFFRGQVDTRSQYPAVFSLCTGLSCSKPSRGGGIGQGGGVEGLFGLFKVSCDGQKKKKGGAMLRRRDNCQWRLRGARGPLAPWEMSPKEPDGSVRFEAFGWWRAPQEKAGRPSWSPPAMEVVFAGSSMGGLCAAMQ
ncbi:A disintegrin and metalloproteinase with thrombospondin motifs 20 [Liparis tanakae]|uniref:A disintegrin and metalloproteinase with thrombospondin motifs 20 n=1 Tax=Liparis tanakae TaxID=230148 RepID=A0A4Z2H9Y4_9TELE|nr:A disintegrin and metalloproteinase with thrombospondin motifs 20 [Liparis tanakae]